MEMRRRPCWIDLMAVPERERGSQLGAVALRTTPRTWGVDVLDSRLVEMRDVVEAPARSWFVYTHGSVP